VRDSVRAGSAEGGIEARPRPMIGVSPAATNADPCSSPPDSTGTTTEYSQAVSMQGANSAQIDTTIYTLTATNVTYQLQSSSDLDNWFNQGSSEAKTVVGSYLLTAITGCDAPYVRIKYTLTGSGKAIFAAGINTSQQ